LIKRFFNTNSIVLNSVRFGEGHKIVNLFTEETGKIEASAFGAKKTKSRFGSKLEPFTSAKILLYRKSEESMYTVRDVEVINSHDSIRSDLYRIMVGTSVIEPVVRFVERAQRDPALYRLIEDALSALNQLPPSKGMFLLSMFDIQFFSIMGYRPDLFKCAKCENTLKKGKVFYDSLLGFPLCENCHVKDSMRVEDSTIKFFKWSQLNSLSISRKVTMNMHTLINLRKVIESIYKYTFHKGLSSWEQLNELYFHSPSN